MRIVWLILAVRARSQHASSQSWAHLVNKLLVKLCYFGLPSYRSTSTFLSSILSSQCLHAHPAMLVHASAGPSLPRLFIDTLRLPSNPWTQMWRNNKPSLLPLQLSLGPKLSHRASVKQIEASNSPGARVPRVANHSHRKAAIFPLES